jgi:hypothetical protein
MSLSASVCVLLSEWISFLLVVVPPRSRRTFVELLIGCMLNPEGWVTRAIGAICREAHWTTYYKLIERAQVPVADLSIHLLRLVQWVSPAEGVCPVPSPRAATVLEQLLGILVDTNHWLARAVGTRIQAQQPIHPAAILLGQ